MPRDLLLLHGFTHTGASWSGVVAALGESYRALAPDLRGHGMASELRPVDLEHVMADLSAQAPPSFTLIGYSMGGRIALHLAAAMPARVERLVLIGASPGLEDPLERDERRIHDEALAGALGRLTIEELARRWAQTPVLAGQPEAVRRAAHLDRLRSTPAGLAAALRGLGTGALPSLWDQLQGIQVPARLIVGERDNKFRVTAERMAARLPRADVRVVPGAGHAVHLEQPGAVAAALGGESL